jgi:hypothetical protein
MTEQRNGREFGKGTLLGDNSDDFFNKPIDEQVMEIGWSHACPVVSEVVAKYGPEWTLKRYAECNFVFGLIVESAKDSNPDLYKQLTKPVARLENEKPGEGHFNPKLVPTETFYSEMSPLSTPWGYAMPRAIIEEVGRGKNNEERTQERILKALDVIEKTVKMSKSPVELLVNMAEEVSKLDADPKAVLSHVLSADMLQEEVCKTIFVEIKREIDESAPTLRKTYDSMSKAERETEGMISF